MIPLKMKAPRPKSLKDIGIYFLMLFIITFLLAFLTYLWDNIADPAYGEDLKFYFAYFLLLRFIFIMPIVWFFVEQFNGKYKEQTILNMVATITLALLLAILAQGDISGSIQTEYKRFYTYPLAGLLAYFIYNKCFSHNRFKHFKNDENSR